MPQATRPTHEVNAKHQKNEPLHRNACRTTRTPPHRGKTCNLILWMRPVLMPASGATTESSTANHKHRHNTAAPEKTQASTEQHTHLPTASSHSEPLSSICTDPTFSATTKSTATRQNGRLLAEKSQLSARSLLQKPLKSCHRPVQCASSLASAWIIGDFDCCFSDAPKAASEWDFARTTTCSSFQNVTMYATGLGVPVPPKMSVLDSYNFSCCMRWQSWSVHSAATYSRASPSAFWSAPTIKEMDRQT